MHRIALLVSAGVLATGAVAGTGPELELHGELGVQRAYASGSFEPALARLDASVSGQIRTERCSARIGLRWRADEYLAPVRQHSGELREAAAECRQGAWLLKAGRQVVVWGKADNFRVLDAVHPFDYREFLLESKEEARRPLTMARVERKVGESDAAQFLLIAERRSDILPGPQDRFAALFPQGALDRAAAPAPVSDQPGLGLKWEHTGQQLGYTFNLLERWSPQDRYGLAPQTASLVREPYRQRLAGGSFDLAVGAWVLRGEAMRTARVWLPASAGVAGMPPVYAPYGQTAWVAGADRSVGEYFLSAQLFESRVTGGEAEPLAGRTQRLLSLSATHAFLQDQLQARLFIARDLREDGTWLSISAEHNFGSGWELSAGADLFDGSDRSAFGRIQQQSRIKLGMKWRR